MKRVALMGLILCCVMGCAAVNWLFGVGEDGEDAPGASPVEVIAPIANAIAPGAGTMLVGIAGAYAEWRRRKWKNVATAQAKGINRARAMKGVDGKIDEAALIKAQIEEQEALKVRTDVRKVIQAIEAAKPS